MKKLLVATKAPFSEEANNALRALAEQNSIQVEIIIKNDINDFLKTESLLKKLKSANALIVRSDKVTKEIIDAAENLEIVVRGGAGYDNVDSEYCTEKGITVMNTPGQNSNGVAELVFYIVGNLLRKVHLLDPTTKLGQFEKEKYPGCELKGKKIGIAGFGYIGQIVAQIAKGFGMEVFVYDPFVNPVVAKDKGAILVKTPEELFTNSFIISLHLPKNKNTIGFVDKKLIKLMKKDSILINTARAEVINEDDLEQALLEMPGLLYGSDVHLGGDKPGEKRFAKFGDRVILTPHIGAGTEEANFNCAVAAARQIVSFFLKGDMTYAVNKEVVPPWMKDYAVLAEKLGYINTQLLQGNPQEVRVIAYDELENYLRPLAGNVLKGMFNDPELKPTDALKLAEKNEIILDLRKPIKKRHNAITIDFFSGNNGETKTSSIRGAVFEGEMKLSRVKSFKNFDFEILPGIALLFEYKDKEGMADLIGQHFAKAGYSKSIGRFKPNDQGDALYMFYIDSKSKQLDIVELKKIVDETVKEISGVKNGVVLNLLS
jgi:D-3-phosphoglycerate dehydrogenase / 2-oxoglutarate reductase